MSDQAPQTTAAPTPAATTETGLPFVSIVMPIRNEAGFIARGLEALLEQDYPADRYEIIVADGMSDDGTREIMAGLIERHPQIALIDNPGRIVSTGLNAAIERAKGDVIIRLDGHAEIARDFIRQNVALFAEHPEAWIVGGPIVHVGRNAFGKATAAAMSSPFGVGMATHRFPDYEGYAEGTAFPAIRNWVFERIGNFDEMLVRNQDDEFNYRVIRAGGKCYISPRVRYDYYVRDTVKKLYRQYFQYSFWRIPVIRKHRRPTSIRQLVPPVFFGTMLLLAIVGIWLRNPWIALALPVIYVVALVLIALPMVRKCGFAVASRVPLAMATMHFAYAVGMVYGLWAAVFYPRAWEKDGRMSALSR